MRVWGFFLVYLGLRRAVWRSRPAFNFKPCDLMKPGYISSINRTWVYFILSKVDNLSYLKIGISSDPVNRMQGLSGANPGSLSLLGVLPGDRVKERASHTVFGPWRRSGEWFLYSHEVEVVVSSLDLSERFNVDKEDKVRLVKKEAAITPESPEEVAVKGMLGFVMAGSVEYPGRWVDRRELYSFISREGFLPEMNFSTHSVRTRFGKLLSAMNGKWLSNGCRVNISGGKNCRKFLFEDVVGNDNRASDVKNKAEADRKIFEKEAEDVVS